MPFERVSHRFPIFRRRPLRSVGGDLHAKLLIALLALLFHVSGALWTALTVPFPSVIDELQHLSYVQEMAKEPVPFPRFEKMKTLDRTLGAFTPTANYLPHPSLYYHLIALIDASAEPAASRTQRLRIANLLLSSVGVILMLYAGMTLLLETDAFAFFAAALVMFPKLAVVGGLINNDNLGVLAVGCCFLGLARLYQGGGNGAGALLGIGLALAGWTKLTVLVMVGIAFAVAALLRLSTTQDRSLWRATAVAGVIGVIGSIPTIENFITYGKAVYASPTQFSVPVAMRPDLDFFDHAQLFLHVMALKWPAFEPAHWIQVAGLVVAVVATLAIVGAEIRGRWRRVSATPTPGSDDVANLLAAAFGLSAMATLVVHITFGWRAFQEIGNLTIAQPRYYYGVWPGIVLAMTQARRFFSAGPNSTLYGDLHAHRVGAIHHPTSRAHRYVPEGRLRYHGGIAL